MMTLFTQGRVAEPGTHLHLSAHRRGLRAPVYTEQTIFDIRDDGLYLIETFGTTYADLAARLDVYP
jgi:hypothetical protein